MVEALKRLVEVEKVENPVLLLIVGSAGLAINLVGLLLFHEHGMGLTRHDNVHYKLDFKLKQFFLFTKKTYKKAQTKTFLKFHMASLYFLRKQMYSKTCSY